MAIRPLSVDCWRARKKSELIYACANNSKQNVAQTIDSLPIWIGNAIIIFLQSSLRSRAKNHSDKISHFFSRSR